MIRLSAVGVLAVLSLLGAAATPASAEKYEFFLERSFFFPGPTIFSNKVLHAPAYYTPELAKADDGEVQFEAQPAPHLFFLNQLDGDDIHFGTSRGEGADRLSSRRWTASFVFMVRLRQLGGFSSPLRNPSFMPRFALQWLRVQRSKKVNEGDWEGRIQVDGPTIVLWGHHSNGGAGCLFKEDVEMENECVSAIPPELRTVNTRNGSFSTDYVRLSYHWLVGQIGKPKNLDQALTWSVTLGAGLELNPPGWGPGAISEDLRRIYGPQRFRLESELQFLAAIGQVPMSVAISPSYEYIRYDEKPSARATPHRFIVDVTATNQRRGFLRGWGVAARFYRGQDFNNLLFIRDIQRFQLGIVVDTASRSFLK